jgi:hypothetical protein
VENYILGLLYVSSNFKRRMRHTIIIILTIFILTNCIGQELAIIRDTVNHFEIGVPAGWRYVVPVDKSIVFIAWRQKENGKDVPRENFNLNLFHVKEGDLNKSHEKILEIIGKAEGFKIIDQGDLIINNRRYKYLIETHKNKISKEDMSHYVLFTNKDGAIFILTMVTISENFENFKTLFHAIALSLKY